MDLIVGIDGTMAGVAVGIILMLGADGTTIIHTYTTVGDLIIGTTVGIMDGTIMVGLTTKGLITELWLPMEMDLNLIRVVFHTVTEEVEEVAREFLQSMETEDLTLEDIILRE